MLSGLTPPVPPGSVLKAFIDLGVGLGRKLRDQHLDALILGLETDEFGAGEADQRRHADPVPGGNTGSAAKAVPRRHEQGNREHRSNERHENLPGLH